MSTNPLCEVSQSLFKGDIVASVIVQTLCMRRREKEGGRGEKVKRGAREEGRGREGGRDGEGGREEEGRREGGGGSGRVKR